MTSRLLKGAGFVALVLALNALVPHALRAMMLVADGLRVALGMGSVL